MTKPLNPPRFHDPGLTPPEMVEGERGLAATSYFNSEWQRRGIAYLSCYRGLMRLFGPSTPEILKMKHCDVVLCTRGLWHTVNPHPKRTRWTPQPSREMLELYFPVANGGESQVIYLETFQVNRMPGWQPGKRCWRLELWREQDYAMTLVRDWPVYWRAAELPCLEPWQGEPQGIKGRPGS